MWTLVEVRGGPTAWAAAEEVWAGHSWNHSDEGTRGTGLTSELDDDPESKVFRVEVRVPGASLRAENEAEWQITRLAKTHVIEMYPRKQAALDRDREMPPRWRVHTTDHRPAEPAPEPSSRRERWVRRWRRTTTKWSERLGRYDTGEIVSGTEADARALARLGREPGEAHRPHVDVRPLDGRDSSRTTHRREDDLERRLRGIAVGLVATATAAVLAGGSDGPLFWLWAVCVAAAFCVVVTMGGKLQQSGGETAGRVFAGCLTLFAVATALGWTPAGLPPGDAGLSKRQVLLGPLFLFVGVGINLLVRRWTGSGPIVWVGPAVLAAAIPVLAVLGKILHWAYRDELGLDADGVEASGLWEAASAVKLLTLLSTLLLLPATWAIARHYHLLRPGGRTSTLGFGLTGVVLALVAGTLGLESAEHAADGLKRAAVTGRTPPSYFGIEPEWMCLQPTVPRAELNTKGGILRPERPYIVFGEGQGGVVAWNAVAGDPMTIPADQVRTVPVGDKEGKTDCLKVR
ncbi:hypothetical protein [Streptomyces stackebrandtii]|uniref:hypothetical protein n=1 Tax=Streptomyces stackebrandtii TaxID=3051177 RepID=UPI0028DC8C7C|nr:hypothetical protein [Streptomyces sp. DSM 40976]